jgi:hypothetical protein
MVEVTRTLGTDLTLSETKSCSFPKSSVVHPCYHIILAENYVCLHNLTKLNDFLSYLPFCSGGNLEKNVG